MNFNGLVPELSVSSIEDSKNFYINILGFKMEYEREEDRFAFVSYGEAQIMLEEINGYWNTGSLEHPFGRGVNFQIMVKDIEKLYKRILSNNIKLFRDIKVNTYKVNNEEVLEKEILVQDTDGYLLRFSETIKRKHIWLCFLLIYFYRLWTTSSKTLPIESLITISAELSTDVELLFIRTKFLPLKYLISPAAG